MLGKGGRLRDLPLPARTRPLLVRWRQVRAEQLGLPIPAAPFVTPRRVREAERARDAAAAAQVTPALFVARGGRRISARSVDHIIRTAGRDAGLEISPHVLRHTFATNLVRDGADLVLVAELLGHARVDTVRIYTLPTEDDVQDAVDRVTVDY